MVTILQSLILGLVQGVTEFLPVSSSAHLILVPRFLGWPDQGLVFDVAANTGTLVAVVWYFRRDLLAMASAGSARLRGREPQPEMERLLVWLLLASVPVAAAGLLLRPFIAGDGRSPVLIASTSIGFGLLLGLADLVVGRSPRFGVRSGSNVLRLRDAALIGGAQALALVPGTSRSGITMTAALFGGFDRETAARVSFLLAIPVSVLAAGRDVIDLFSGAVPPEQWLHLGIVLVASSISGYAVIAGLLAWLRRRGLAPFVVYRIVLGIVILWLMA